MGELTTVQIQPKAKRHAVSATTLAVAVSILAMTNVANAAIDVTPVTSELSDLITPIGLVGAAYLLVMVAIKGWKIIRR
ncbi:major capsid protein, partial [Acinetobacter nosocomialis]